jgi:integrase
LGELVFHLQIGTFRSRALLTTGLDRTQEGSSEDAREDPALRFQDLRHTFASHLTVDLGLDVAQVSCILGHASITITLDVYTHLFDDARHAGEIRRRMETGEFAALLESDGSAQEGLVVELRSGGRDNVRTSG